MISDPLVAAAGRIFHVCPYDIRSKSRHQPYVDARQAVCYVLRVRWGARYAAIAKAVGYREHSMAHHSVYAAAGRMQREPRYLAKVVALAGTPVPGGRALRSLLIHKSRRPWAPDELEHAT